MRCGCGGLGVVLVADKGVRTWIGELVVVAGTAGMDILLSFSVLITGLLIDEPVISCGVAMEAER